LAEGKGLATLFIDETFSKSSSGTAADMWESTSRSFSPAAAAGRFGMALGDAALDRALLG
jgi:hypothetical protein